MYCQRDPGHGYYLSCEACLSLPSRLPVPVEGEGDPGGRPGVGSAVTVLVTLSPSRPGEGPGRSKAPGPPGRA
jgi:hypothetical protein